MSVIAADTPAAARYAGGESSPASSESTFRELDDVFLQTQTRIWLGEVLQTRLNEHDNIAQMLSDGELLFEVSQTIWEMIITKRMELAHLNSLELDPFVSRKHSGRYTPYCNVDSFLKICKSLGLSGIDLFSPSDVVEQKNTRKVCMCIRLLSKKARSKCFDVPDFDIVTRTVSMSTDMVGFIRRSLEISQCSSSNSSGFKSLLDFSTLKTTQRRFAASADSPSSEDINGCDINILQSDSVFLQDTDYEDYHSGTNCRGEMDYEQNACKSNSTPLGLIHQSVSKESFSVSTKSDQSIVISAGDSCGSNLCFNETDQTAGLTKEIRDKTRDECFDLSPVSSLNSVAGPLRLDFDDEHNTRDHLNEKDDLQSSKHENPKRKKRPFTKSIMSGTAIIGVMLLFLRFRNGGKSGKIKESDSKTRIVSMPAQKRKNEVVQKGVYPAEKLKLRK